MGCFCVCTGKSNKRKRKRKQRDSRSQSVQAPRVSRFKNEEEEDLLATDLNRSNLTDNIAKDIKGYRAQNFTFEELATATRNFTRDCFIGEGGFGKVYKGYLERLNQAVAVKRLDRSGGQGIREFVVEVYTLSIADHPNLVRLLGFCAEGHQRLLVYEYMPLGSLESHLHDLQTRAKVLDWWTRMKIAAGAAKGLEYLHDRMTPPVIYRDLKCSNVLLGEGYHPKLSDFGLAKVGPSGDQTHVSTRVMGTYGYCAPEYAKTGRLTFPSDVYSFGVLLLELITGRKALDRSRARGDRNLVQWATPMFRDRSNYTRMVDPNLRGQYPVRGLYQALAIASMCVSDQPNMRPMTSDIVLALHYLSMPKNDSKNHLVQYSGTVAH